MKNKVPIAFVIIGALVLLITGCSKNADFEGVILSVDNNQILISKTLSPQDYANLDDKSAHKLQNEELEGKRSSLGLIYISYKRNHKFVEGDFVNVWIKGAIMESYPEQATARKITLKQAE